MLQNMLASLTEYERELITERGNPGITPAKPSDLGVTPQVDGKLTFPVLLRPGEQHDLNELSSGEREVMYGNLRLRNLTPTHSTILLESPSCTSTQVFYVVCPSSTIVILEQVRLAS